MAREAALTPSLDADEAVVIDDIVGPIRLAASSSAVLDASDGQRVVRRDGTSISTPLQPGEEFYIRSNPGSRGVTLTVRVPGEADGFGGRVITGVARDELAGRYTPLALAVPAQLVVEFDIEWYGL